MDVPAIKKWVMFFIGILVAIITADWISNLIVTAAGISGWSRFVVSFILYAVLFFAILYGIERVTGIRFFGGCGCSDDP
jgi:predicted membrane protein